MTGKPEPTFWEQVSTAAKAVGKWIEEHQEELRAWGTWGHGEHRLSQGSAVRATLQRLAPVLPQRREDLHEEVAVGDRMAHFQRGVPGGEHRQVVLVEVGDGLDVVRLELGLGDLVHPRVDDVPDELTARVATDGLGDDADRILGLDEAQCHGWNLPDGSPRKVGACSDGKCRKRCLAR
jgi:hypothetical protein